MFRTKACNELTPPLHRTPPGPQAGRSLVSVTPNGRDLFPGHAVIPGFDAIMNFYGASAVVYTCSSFRRLPDPLIAGLFPSRFPPRLLTGMTLGRFGISACTANPEGLPPSLAQHGSYWRLSTSSSRSFQDTHSAESFFWISTTCLDLSSSFPSRSTSLFQRGRSHDHADRPFGVPPIGQGRIRPLVRWRRQVTINEEYRPSRRSIAPLSTWGRPSYSARTLALYLAENCRRPEERSGTSGSGGACHPSHQHGGACGQGG